MLATIAEQLCLYKPPAATDEHDDDDEVVSKVCIFESATPVVVMFLYTGYLECYSTRAPGSKIGPMFEMLSESGKDKRHVGEDDFRWKMMIRTILRDTFSNHPNLVEPVELVGPIKEGFIVGFDLLKTFIDMGSRIKANEGSSLEVYDAKVSARSRLHLLKTIGSKLAFKPERYKNFRSTVFGLWLDIRTQEHDNHLINYLLQHQRNVKDPSTDIPFIFDIGPNTIEFGRRKFCLVTGFLFGDCSLDHLKGVNSCFHERVFSKNSSVKGLDLNKLLNNHTEFNKLLDDDVVRVCLLLALDFVFMGFELRYVIANELLGLVDDLSAWNDFPWGEYIWIELHKRVYNDDSKYRERHLKKLAIMGPTFMTTYTLQGFVFAFKIWLLETYPNSKTWWVEEKNVRNRLCTLTPSSDEMKQKWWRMSLEYFYNVSKAKVHHEVDVRTNVHHDVDEGLSVPDVHHDVEEGLSVLELLKKISDMQRDFQSRITAVEQFVNHHKTSKIGSDSHVTNVFSNSMEFDHHDFVSLTKNPHNRVALMKKITDMENSNVAAECMSVDKNTSNVDAECMSIDKNPSCGSDVKVGNKESMWVDSFVKFYLLSFCVYVQVVEQNEFDQNVADKNLIHDFDQTVEWKILLNDEVLEEPQLSGPNFIVEEHQQVSSKNCEVPLAGAEKIAVDALMKIINFDIPKESPIQPMVIETPVEGCKSGETSKSMISETQSHTCDSVEEANDAKVQREAKASKYRISPYMIQPESTQQNHKVRTRNKKVKKRGLPLTAHDGKVIPDWKEDLFRPKHAPKTRTIVPPEISDMLRDNKDKCFHFPWTNEGSFVCSKFWESLLGIGKERRGWVSDTHLDIWVFYLWHYRLAEADWAIYGPIFNTFMLGDKMPCCYADGVTYGVPWFSEFVKNVYFPINAEDNHWILAEFHICSGVITFYDSLPSENLIVED
ncbi:phospholipase-like protein [Tanacetum coccineum]